MNIIYYCPVRDAICRKIKRIIEVMVSLKKFETLSSMKIMEDHLRSSLSDDFVIILQVGSFAELQNIIALKELLIDHRIILILPDDDPGTTVLAHTLRPRLITYRDSDFLDVASVLSRMNFKADNL
ncbi:MAG: hypothetical protein WCO53_01055 [Deltaproteobacteria bacterium]